MAFSSKDGALVAVLLDHLDVAIIQSVDQVHARFAGLAGDHFTCLKHDDILTMSHELVGGLIARDAGADNANVRLCAAVKLGERRPRGLGVLMHPDWVCCP